MMKYTTLPQEHQKEWMGFGKKLSKISLTKDMTLGINIIYKHLEDSMTLHRNDWSVLSVLQSPNTPNKNMDELQLIGQHIGTFVRQS